jgi:RNA binding exosome subunit
LDALRWLTADSADVSVKKTRSWFNSTLHLITVRTTGRAAARRAVTNLGPELLLQLLEESDTASIDDENIFHLRLSLSDLVRGRIELAQPNSKQDVIKGRIKLAVFHGEEATTVFRQLVHESAQRAERQGLPRSADEWKSKRSEEE